MRKTNKIIEKSRNLLRKVLFKARRSEKVHDIRRSTYTEGVDYFGEPIKEEPNALKYFEGEVNGTNLGDWYAWDPKGVEENE